MDTRRHPIALDDAAYDGRYGMETDSRACRRLARWRSSQNRPARAADFVSRHDALGVLSVAVADIWQWTPFVAILCYAALQGLPEDIVEAARVDGASSSNVLWHITLPMLAPTLLAILLLRVVIAFKLFDLVYGLTFGGPGFDTTVAAFQVWRTALAQFDIGLASAQTIIFAILVSLVTLPLTWLHRYSEAHAE
jgi:multiple sugar transport system permease protein